jgi:DNA-binding protein HU-beta
MQRITLEGGSIMNKTELVKAVADKTLLSKKDSEKAVSAVFDTITEQLAEGNKVVLVGFGTFEVRDRAARKGRNPSTKEEIMIPASKAPAFKAGKNLKAKVNN